MIKSKTHNFHIPLSEDLYKELKSEALNSRLPVTELIRNAIKTFLENRKKENIYNSIRSYAENYGGTDYDLDTSLDSASIECINYSL